MSAAEMVSQWQQAVKHDLLAGLHGHQAKAIAVLSWAMAMAGSCAAAAVAPLVPSAAKLASVRRRMERLLANDRLDAADAMLRMSRALLRDWGGRKLPLILDETPKQNHLRCMKLSVAYRKRTVTLLSVCYRPQRPPMPMPTLVRWMLRQVAACLPAEGVTVTLLADRGLCWPTLIRQCRRLGWHYLLRLQADTRVKLADGTETAVSDLVPRPDVRWFGQDVRVFKKPRWLVANVVAVWEPACKGPWLLAGDAGLSCSVRAIDQSPNSLSSTPKWHSIDASPPALAIRSSVPRNSRRSKPLSVPMTDDAWRRTNSFTALLRLG